MASNEKTSPCPTCEKDVARKSDVGAFPFCSPRCQLADLGKWLDGGYSIAGDASPTFDD